MRGLTLLAAGPLVLGPAVLAFFDGGYFDRPRLVAGIVAWALVALAAVFAERPFPRYLPGWLAIGGLVLLTAWTALSLAWAPLRSQAMGDVQRLALYSGVLIAAAAWLRPPRAATLVEPGLALGVIAVVGYGMSERFLPGLLEHKASMLAFGRLEQPITYWNGMGIVAAIGLVLVARLAGSSGRPRWLRALAAGGAPLLGAGLLLTFSRGAMAAGAAGLFLLLVLAPERGQTRAVALTVATAVCAAVPAAVLPGVDVVGPEQSSSSGAVLLCTTLLLGCIAAFAQWRIAGEPADTAPRARKGIRRWGWAVVTLVAITSLVAVAAAIDSNETGGQGDRQRAGAQRLRSLESPRYRYWGVAVGALASDPLTGVGTAGFRVEWAREGDRGSFAREAHSLYFETAAELGLAGLALLAMFGAGLVLSARRALARDPAAAAGPVAVMLTWALHAGIDWDWELPAVTLPALICGGVLVASGDLGARRSAPANDPGVRERGGVLHV
ncbi:MAG TPA: O-antigen ligase family protein [Thermoleophilaceae bacterium]|nr:O-antigen ligase family protein [Thermoleophilaceae bacterium]